MFVGGFFVFGEEGYLGGVFEVMLLIEFNVEEEWCEVFLMIVFDKSYSMKGEKMEFVKEVMKVVFDVFEDEYCFGVVIFDWNFFDVVLFVEVLVCDEMIEVICCIEVSV